VINITNSTPFQITLGLLVVAWLFRRVLSRRKRKKRQIQRIIQHAGSTGERGDQKTRSAYFHDATNYHR
jgi:hypothetical protein